MLFGVNIFMFHFLLKIQNLHIGPRPKNSIYSGGQTAWQDPEEKEKNLNRFSKTLVWLVWSRNKKYFKFNLKNFTKIILKISF
jgi:hypothetical protein